MRNLQVIHDTIPPKEYFIVKERKRNAPRKIYWFWDTKDQKLKSGYIEYMSYNTQFVSVKSDNQSKSGWHTANLKLKQLFDSKRAAEQALETARAACLRNYGMQITDTPSALRFPTTHDINPNPDGIENLARTAYLERCKDLFNLDLTAIWS